MVRKKINHVCVRGYCLLQGRVARDATCLHEGATVNGDGGVRAHEPGIEPRLAERQHWFFDLVALCGNDVRCCCGCMKLACVGGQGVEKCVEEL